MKYKQKELAWKIHTVLYPATNASQSWIHKV